MPLTSRLFKDSEELQRCLVSDAAHVVPGARGFHVKLIQRALVMLGDRSIPSGEYIRGEYGKMTAEAVLRFKRQRQIINHSYQTSADDIVGKMTIDRLDKEVRAMQDNNRFNH